ncbi:hypothetical protein L1987_10914 [Smallanthus sonchifolius]|uniref:Uncharacterized protein n=1 Tax=Smallanthus sonchifolius TaxID=185202 RepID=A0ACB9JA25_9ASTR|nr:hypothetical protein L1987_10914 [Smallanthus sonchifolius]
MKETIWQSMDHRLVVGGVGGGEGVGYLDLVLSTTLSHPEAYTSRHSSGDQDSAEHDSDTMDMWNGLSTITRCTHNGTGLHGHNFSRHGGHRRRSPKFRDPALTRNMKSSKAHQEEDYEEYGAKKDNNPSSKDGKNSDKLDATRSKHSVTEQRRRSKINERFQILRDLIPNSDQKRDTASFLLEVIEYVQYLQERVQKYEGSYQGWSAEPTKLMPWRNSHWRVPGFGHQPVIKPDSGLTPSFPVRFDENVSIAPVINTGTQNPARSDPGGDVNCNLMDSQPELASKMAMPAVQPSIPVPIQQADGTFSHSALHCNVNMQSSDVPVAGDANQQEEVTVEGGTISISSVYSQGLLSSLTQALQNSGVDLTQATISVQVDLGKRANRGLTSGTSAAKDHENPHTSNQEMGRFQEFDNGGNSDQPSKRLKT